MSDYSHPNDSKRIELLTKVFKQADKALAQICASYMSVVDDDCEGYFKAKEELLNFEAELKRIEDSKQGDFFE